MAFSVEFLLGRLEEQGLFNIILPLLLVFAIVYGILGKIGLFGDNDKINAIVAFVLGMYVTVFSEFALFLTNITAGGVTVLVGLLFFLMIVGFGSSLSGGSPTSVLSDYKEALTIVLMLIGGILFVNSGGLLIVGGYSVRVGLGDIFQLTGLYVAFVVVKSLLGVGNADFNKVRKLINQYNRLNEQRIDNPTPEEKNRNEEIKRQKNRLFKKIQNKVNDVQEDNNGFIDLDGTKMPIRRRRYGRYGRYGRHNHYDDDY